MTYAVKEIFYSLQGEGINAGRPTVFCRFSGCNLWSGREEDRASSICQFCDTDFVGTDGTLGGKYKGAFDLVRRIASLWPADVKSNKFVVLTGGEPLLQVDEALVDALHDLGFEVGLETNGTILAPQGIDWICVSPKAGTQLIQKQGHELKLVFPQEGLLPTAVEHLSFDYFLLQPMDGPLCGEFRDAALKYCLTHPNWRLSIQMHKLLGIR